MNISAPITGRVGLGLVDPGNVVEAESTTALVVAQLQPVTVVFTIADDSVPDAEQRDVAADAGFEKLDGSRVIVTKTVILPTRSLENEP